MRLPQPAPRLPSQDEHARDALALRMRQVDAEKHGTAVMVAQLVLDTARAARDAAATYEEGIRGSSVSPPDNPVMRHKATMELRPSASLRRSGDAVTIAEATLRNAVSKQARARRAIEAAQAPQMDLGNAPQRLHQLQLRRPRRRPLCRLSASES